MDNGKKKRFFLNHKKSSAMVVSIAIHVVFVILAFSFVAVTAVIKPEQVFTAKPVTRPKMNLRKLQVPVNLKKTSRPPKLRQTLVVKTPSPHVDIRMPEIIGVKGGFSAGGGGGLASVGFGFDLDLFGSSKSRGGGNEFIGHFYDLKQTPRHELTPIGKLAEENTYSGEAQELYTQAIHKLIRSGLKASALKSFYVAPKEKFATSFNLPPMDAAEAPKAFGVEDEVKPSYWICVYRGQIAAPADGKYRFVGFADDVLIVRLNRRVVLDACWPAQIGKMTDWQSSDEDSRKFQVNRNDFGEITGGDWNTMFQKLSKGYKSGENWGSILSQIKTPDGQSYSEHGNYLAAANRLVLGDWVELKKGQRIDMEVLIGEIPGGSFGCRLLVEQKGGSYPAADSDAGQRPLLPIFKTVPVDERLVDKMRAYPNEMTLDGPVFGVIAGTK